MAEPTTMQIIFLAVALIITLRLKHARAFRCVTLLITTIGLSFQHQGLWVPAAMCFGLSITMTLADLVHIVNRASRMKAWV